MRSSSNSSPGDRSGAFEGVLSTPPVVGYRVLVCENMAFPGDFQPVLAKHSKHFSLPNALSIDVDEMQRNFDGMRMRSALQAAVKPARQMCVSGRRKPICVIPATSPGAAPGYNSSAWPK